MGFAWIGLILEILIFMIIKPLINDFELASFVVIGINFLFFILSFIRYRNTYSIYFLLAYILRVIFMVWDIYFSGVITLPHSGIDSERFFYFSTIVSSNLGLLKGPIYGSVYTKVLGILFYLTSPQKLIGQYINVLLGVSIIDVIYKILCILKINENVKKASMIIISLMPHSIIFSAILLRENIISLFAILSFYYFIKWYKYNKKLNIIYCIIYIGIASTFHSGVIGLLIGYVFMFLFYNHNDNVIYSNKNTLIYLVIIFLVSFLLYGKLNNILLTKFNKIDSVDDIYNQANVRGGGSAYLPNLQVTSFATLILFGPVKILFFLVSPLPFNWRSIKDILSFLMDSSIYLLFLYYILRNYKKHIKKNPLMQGTLIMILIVLVIFGVGVSNAGTAMRHRQKIFPIFLVLHAMILDSKKKKITRN